MNRATDSSYLPLQGKGQEGDECSSTSQATPHPQPDPPLVGEGGLRHKVFIEDCAVTYQCGAGQTVLRGMESLGNRGIPVGCREGGCGVCKVEIVEGTYRKRVMSREQVSEDDERADRVLACCIWPTSDLRLRVVGKMLCAVRKSGSGTAPCGTD